MKNPAYKAGFFAFKSAMDARSMQSLHFLFSQSSKIK